MTNYNERLDEILQKFALNQQLIGDQYGRDQINELSFELKDSEYRDEAKQAIISLIKELVAEAKPYRETIIDKWNKDRVDEVKATNAAMNAWADIYEQNLLKALEEV